MNTYIDGLQAAKKIVDNKIVEFPDDSVLVEISATLVSVIELETNLYEKDIMDEFE